MANKAEISWKRTTEDGEKLQVYAYRANKEWNFFQSIKPAASNTPQT